MVSMAVSMLTVMMRVVRVRVVRVVRVMDGMFVIVRRGMMMVLMFVRVLMLVA